MFKGCSCVGPTFSCRAAHLPGGAIIDAATLAGLAIPLDPPASRSKGLPWKNTNPTDRTRTGLGLRKNTISLGV